MFEPTETDELDADQFPLQGDARDKLRFALRWAVRAPSSHNSQPWCFRLGEDFVDVVADRARALPVVDPEDRELTMSCGAAMHHLRVAMACFGMGPEVTVFPEADDADLLARVRIGEPREPTDEEWRMLDAIPKRRTNRGPFAEEPVPSDVLDDLERASRDEDAWLVSLTELGDKIAAADLVAEGDRIQMDDRRFRRELAAFIHPGRSLRRDGIPGYALGMNDVVAATAPLVVRLFDLGKGTAARDRQLAEGSPVLVVIGTAQEEERGWLAAGCALSRVLLLATAEGLDASYLNQPVEVPELRRPLAELTGDRGFPQLLLRLGRGEAARPTPRRPLEDVLIQ